jgi:hypothetical protein
MKTIAELLAAYPYMCTAHSKAQSIGRQLPNYEFSIGQDDRFDPWGECGGS